MRRIFFVAIWACVCMVSSLEAQIGTTGTFSGIVLDNSGAVIPEVTVTATHVSTAASQSTKTDGKGQYQIPLLPLGDYRIEASHPGFKTKVVSGASLTVGKTQEVNFTLDVGDVAEAVNVEAQATLIETQSSTVSSLVSSKEVSALPLNGRSFDQLIMLSVGTNAYNDRNVNAFRGYNNFYSVGGTRPATTVLMIDGAEYAGGAGVTTNVNTSSGKMLGVDGIQEFAVVSNSGNASYGKEAGGQVTIATRAGTNDFHGSVFEFLRNSAVDARDFFSPVKPPLRRNNYGFSFGGPIRKDKTFFFTNLERLQEFDGSTSVVVVPDINARKGLLPSGQLALNPASVAVLNFYPLPNRGVSFGDGTAQAGIPAHINIADTFGLARVDHHLSDKDTLFGRYLAQSGERDDSSAGVGSVSDITPARVQLATAGWTRTMTATLINQATASFNRGYSLTDNEPLPGVTIPSVFFMVPGQPKPGSIMVSGLPTLNLGNAQGAAGRSVARNVFEGDDQVIRSTGAHALQIGVMVQRIQSNEFEGAVARGQLMFSSGLSSLIIGNPTQFGAPLPGSDGFKSFRETYVGTYIQDGIHLTRNFNLNLGLRWEFMSNPTEVHNRIANWTPIDSQLTGAYSNTAPFVTHLFAKNNSGNFGPRVGFAWDVFGNGKTAVRSGFGVFYNQIENEFRGDNSAGSPYWLRVNVTPPLLTWPNPGQALATQGQFLPYGIDRNAKVPTVLQYNFRIEQTIAPQTILAVAYVGSHGDHLVRQAMPQILPPFLNSAGRLMLPQTLNNPNLNNGARFQVFDANSFYNSMQIEVTKNLSRGLRFKNSFTWSKSIDDAVQPVSMPNGQAQAATVAADHKFDRGLAPYDTRRQLVSNWTYALPAITNARILAPFVKGWELGGILTLSAGHPFTASLGFTRNSNGTGGSRVDLAPGANKNPSSGVTAGCGFIAAGKLGTPNRYFDPCAFLLPPLVGELGNLGNGTIIGPGLATLDWTMSKNIRFTERFSLLFRADFFNLLNRANFSIPTSGVFLSNSGNYSGSAGVVQGTLTDARQIQFGLKLMF